jgi:site-specific recombinase XerD
MELIMSTSLLVTRGGDLPAMLGLDLSTAIDLAKAEKAPATRRAYASDFRLFQVYCNAKGISALPAAPETVAAYIAAESLTAKTSTIGRRIAAIRYAHKLKKAPAIAARMLSMVAVAPDRLSDLRDHALLLIGFAGAFRRSELVALDVADIEETPAGLLITIRRGKTDQEALGRVIAIARGDVACPVKALREWLDAADIVSGPLFRPINKSGTVAVSRLTCRSVANIVKDYAGRAGFDAAIYSGHSLRSGFLTSAAGRGASIFKMMDQSGHKSIDTLRGYVRDAELFKDHAGAGLL